MPYVPVHVDWEDQPSTATPITGAALEAIEAGIVAAYALGENALAKTLADAKGDLLVATAADVVARLARGAVDTVPVADDAPATGIAWKKIGNAMIASDAAIAASKLAGFPNDVTKALLGDGSWGVLQGAPTGAVIDFAGATAPTGWLLCDGSAVSRATYVALNTLLSAAGYPYGAGDGSTTFNIPDGRGRVVVMQGTHTDVDVLGESDGAALADRRVKHKHTVNDSGHTHRLPTNSIGSAQPSLANVRDPGFGTVTTESSTTGVTVGPQTNVPTDGPAYIVLNKIIKT